MRTSDLLGMASPQHTTSDIAIVHQDLIKGMEMLYHILIELNYVQNTDVQVPPHGLPKDPIAVAPLRAAGLDPETIELIGKLPCFTNDIIERQRKTSSSRDGIAIVPSGSATSYLLGSGRHDEARGVGHAAVGREELLPSSAFKLATSSNVHGLNIAYDLDDMTIIRWHTDAWAKCQRIPVTDFFVDWLQKFNTLEWLPWQDHLGWEVESQQTERHRELGCSSPAATGSFKDTVRATESASCGVYPNPVYEPNVENHEVQKAAYNHYQAKQLIYTCCGWPKAFDKDKFREERSSWNTKVKHLGAFASLQTQAA